MSMSERIAMFNKSKIASQAAPTAAPTPTPIKQDIKENTEKLNCRESFLKLASQEKKKSIVNPANSKSEVKNENKNQVNSQVKENKILKDSDQSNSKPDNVGKQLHFDQENTATEDKSNNKPKEFKKGLTMSKGKSEKVFGIANQLENRFKMMGMMGGPMPQKQQKRKDTEDKEESENQEDQSDENDNFFKKKGRSLSFHGDKQLNKLIELNLNQIDIMNSKPSIQKKKKTVKPTFKERPSQV